MNKKLLTPVVRISFINRMLLFILFALNAFGQLPTSKSDSIPDNIAYGKPTVGGANGRVIKVTNLNSAGRGSLKAAIRASGPRIVVFEVAGIIDLNRTRLNISEPNLTIAGQTAPSPGITIIKGSVNVRTHDVIIQHIRVRPGDAGAAKRSGYEPDGLSAIGSNAYDIIVDHCSFSWGVDENLSASGSRKGYDSTSHKITFSNNIIAEGLYQSSHSKGIHSMGTLVHDFVKDIAIIGNLYSCNNQRNPFFKAFTKGAVINNVIFNPGMRAIHMNWSEKELALLSYPPANGQISVVGNVLYQGINSADNLSLLSGTGDAYLEDNLAYGVNGRKIPIVSGNINILQSKPSWPNDFKALNAHDIVRYVTKHVGARPGDRDSVDQRIIDDFINFRGRKINSQEDVGGYPTSTPVYRKLNVPTKGIDKWLATFTSQVQ